MVNVSAVILAAGYSSRMGEFKALLKYKDKTFIEELVHTYKRAGIHNIIVVTGYKSELLESVFNNDETVKLAFNKNYDDGMYSSILTGLDYIGEDDAFFINPVDCPLIKIETVNEIMKQFMISDKSIIYPNFNQRRGHPPLISSAYIDYLKSYSGDHGLRGALKVYVDDSYDFEVKDGFVLDDIDNKLEYEKVLSRDK